MLTIADQIKAVEDEIRETPYNKSTEKHIGILRAKISRLKAKEVEVATRKSGGGGGYAVKKQGDATVILVGPPSVGKSTLITRLTNAKSKIAPYAFTTLTVIPGMLNYKDAKIQVLDVPGIIGGAAKGKGRGKEVLSVARGADLIVLITDVEKLDNLKAIETDLYENGVRINTPKPKVIIEKKDKGSVSIHSNIRQDIGRDTILEIAKEFGHKNAKITLKENLSIDRLIDAFSANRVYTKAITIVNKADLISGSLKEKIRNDYANYNISFISAENGDGVDDFIEKIWSSLKLVRVYLVRSTEAPGTQNPMVMKVGQTLEDVLSKISSELSESKTQGKIWGAGAKFPGQVVALSTEIQEGMQVRFV